jgi:tight adherence protein B
MTGLLTAFLLAAAVLTLRIPPPLPPALASVPAPGRMDAGGSAARRPVSWFGGVLGLRRTPVPDPQELPLFVHQLTGLLRAGRSPTQLWQDLENVYGEAAVRGSVFAVQALPVISTARRSAALGLSVPAALRSAGIPGSPPARDPARAGVPPGLWRDLAACFSVAERSGAPLADVLARYAVQLDAALDARAARDTALAGPKATVALLSWLPVAGILLGYLMGVNPLAVLFGTPAGTAALLLGAGLMAAGRLWSKRLVAAAVRED